MSPPRRPGRAGPARLRARLRALLPPAVGPALAPALGPALAFALLSVLLPAVLLAACASAGTSAGTPAAPSGDSPAGTGIPWASDGAPASPLVGVVVDVDVAGLTRVEGFVLRTAAGREVTFRLAALENATDFPPAHLAEHLATGSPVRVHFRDEDGVLTAYRIEDAEAAPGS